MALFPANQIASQELLVKGNINVITNVREDHQDVMGETLEEIAATKGESFYRGKLAEPPAPADALADFPTLARLVAADTEAREGDR